MSRVATRRASVLYRPPVVVAAGGWWAVSGKTCIAAYQPKGAASLAASYVNLANPGTYDATEGSAPGWDTATGWTFNGSSQYLNSGVNPADGYSMLVAFNSASSAGYLVGRRNNLGESHFSLLPIGGSGERSVRLANTAITVTSGAITSGVYGLAGTVAYLNGTPESGTLSGALGGTIPVYLGAFNNNNVAGFGLVSTIVAFVIYGATLTSGEVATVSAAMAAL